MQISFALNASVISSRALCLLCWRGCANDVQ
ncbi:hypothetical protein T4D_15221 [Trichinella pseudospiralis]|uniref:Uncharacterized protein n=1 Tax=Trichinella pseudospiralis TaxID=6337 RepID=A0A0V1DRS4_TRIPS|nr:hypothetical protein T4D_14065 [Trichinella pseudospiralis]KRY63683.1 hypothetical protein T4D_15221 [Trichinella pseudospiralis]